jgi:hypothetical protein
MTPSGIEPATFRFVAQYLNHCATISGPHNIDNTILSQKLVHCPFVITDSGKIKFCKDGMILDYTISPTNPINASQPVQNSYRGKRK